MNARLENDLINLYDDNEILIGSLKIKSNFKESELVLNNQTFKLIRDGWKTKIIEDSIEKFNLKTNSLLGNTEVLETGHKITGEWGIKWATKLIDDKENTLLKIRNENSFLDNGKYEIKVTDLNVSKFNILLTLYGHLYGSSLIRNSIGGAG